MVIKFAINCSVFDVLQLSHGAGDMTYLSLSNRLVLINELSKARGRSYLLNTILTTVSYSELERTVVMEPTDTSNPPNTIVGVLIAVIVIFALIVLLLVFLLRNKQFVSFSS